MAVVICDGSHRPWGLCAHLLRGFILSVLLVPSVQAKDVCLRIAMPEIHVSPENMAQYRRVMADAGLCVEPASLPQIRAVAALRAGKIDGVFAGQDDFPELVDIPVVPGEVVLGKLPGLLIVRKGPVTGFDDLDNEVLGVPLGATWPRKLIAGYANIVRVPRGAEMLKEMLREGRIDAMLLDGYSLNWAGGVPDGYNAIPVATITVHSWLRAEFAEHIPKFDQGTRAYLKAVQEEE